MALTDGYRRYVCDVKSCSKETFAQPNTDAADSYVTRKRIDANGEMREMLLCSDHIETYATVAKACDEAFNAFEFDGDVTIHSQAEVDGLNEELDQLASDYDAIRKNRDHWVTEYNKLKAEYDAYKEAHPEEGGE